MVASVPEETKRTLSIGVRATISSASSTSGSVGVPYDVPRATAAVTAACTSGCAWPSSIGPHEQIRSTYSLPSTSVSQAPLAEAMKRGVPPTALNARTGEFTPPGVTARARSKSSSDRRVGPVVAALLELDGTEVTGSLSLIVGCRQASGAARGYSAARGVVCATPGTRQIPT